MHDYSLLRSWLFVPGDSERKLQKCWQSGADALIVDLEDAVAVDNKLAARGIAAAAIAAADRGRALVSIRVNALDTGLTFEDLEQTIACRPDAYVLPKVLDAADVTTVSRKITELEARHGREPGSVRLVPIVTEHPRAVMHLEALCNADPRVAAVMWGTEDLSGAIGARRVKDGQGRMLEVFRVVRALALLAASAAGLASLDTPLVELDDLEALRREAAEAAAMGFTSKVAIHPSQVAVINEAFLPDPGELEFASALLEAQARTPDGAFRFRGKMIDMPHIRIARRMVALAAAHKAA
jgi:citrate lyase subunit beta/citryl-CoA lyase